MHTIQINQYKMLNIPRTSKYTENDLELAVFESIIKLANQWAKKEKPAEQGDEITVTLQAHCDGTFIPELSQSNFKYVIGSPLMLEQFNEALSKKVGDCFHMEITFPENAPIERIRGKEVCFNVKIQDLSPSRQPEITDALAKKIDPQTSNLEELKNKLKKVISNNWDEMINEATLQSIFDVIIENCHYELDQDEFDKVYKSIITDTQKRMFSVTDPKTLEVLFSSGGDNDFYNDCKILAKRNVLEELVIKKVIELENIEITHKEFDAVDPTFKNSFSTDTALIDYLLREKVCRYLLAWNTVNE